MVLEATMLVLDNSEWMRNGDYVPNRFEAQNDAVQLLFNAKRQMNPENTVGIISASGMSPKVLVTLTQEQGRIVSALHQISIGGKSHILDAIQVAQLALKHRQNKNQQQRIIVFIASPLSESEEDLVRTAKILKKNGVAIDIINFGEDVKNITKLEALISSANNNDNSHLVSIPPGPNILSDALLDTSILRTESAMQFEFGVDPDLDPELALALRMSLEEERARQQLSENVTESKEDQKTEDTELSRAISMSLESNSNSNNNNGKRKYSEDKDASSK